MFPRNYHTGGQIRGVHQELDPAGTMKKKVMGTIYFHAVGGGRHEAEEDKIGQAFTTLGRIGQIRASVGVSVFGQNFFW